MPEDVGGGSDGDTPGAGSSGGGVPSQNSNIVIILVFVLVLIAAAVAVYWYFYRDTRPDVWDEATVPYEDTVCAEEGACEAYAITGGGHGGHDPEGAVQLYYNPAIDDEIAQWGDCLGSVFSCIETGMLEAGDAEPDRAVLITSCVAEADCPGECKDRFAERSRGRDFDSIEALFFDMFVDERGYCVPRQADQ